MKSKPLPAASRIEAEIDYDPLTGAFFRRRTGRKLDGRNTRGYVIIRVGGKAYYAHRLAWLMVNRTEPPLIDHVNRIPHDNRISNLREASWAESSWNRARRKKSKSKYKGLTLRPHGRFQVRIMTHGKRVDLGSFSDEEEARKAYQKAAKKSHGRFAR